MPLADLIRDNPILIRHMRARLRWQQVVTALVIVLVLSGCLTLLGLFSLLTNDPSSAEAWYGAVILTVVLQGLILFLVGGGQVGNAVGAARESGMMDFHRISPQPPSALALGFLIGAPIREYMLSACTLPGYALLVTVIPPSLLASGNLQVDQLWLLPLVMLVLALLYHTIGIIGGLSVSGAQRRNAGVLVILVVIIVTTLGLFPPMAYLSFLAPLWLALNEDLSNLPIQFTFFGAHLPIVFLSLLHQGTLFAFCWLAVLQKIRQENTPPFTRPVALLFFAATGFLHQYFLLKFRKQGNNYFALTLFLGWLLPIIFGLLLASLQADGVVWEATMSFSPLAGLGLAFHPDNGALCSVITISVTVLWTIIALGLMSPTVARLTCGVWIAARPELAPTPAK